MAPHLILDTIEVVQPFGSFYLVKIKARELLEISFTDPLRYELGRLKGNQRLLDEQKRVKEIKEFVEGYDASFPNTIIISANYDENGFNCDDDEIRWKIVDGKLVIPTSKKLSSIIDGQHRLFGFENANEYAQEMELACSVYLDLPNALQAFLFATINSNQKKVDKSLAYEQFGFNIDKEEPISWAPDKLAISLYKKFNDDSNSPFYRHIKIAPQIDEVLRKELKQQKWLVSTATVVDGIIRLISSNPKDDKYQLQKFPLSERKRTELKTDSSPLRQLFLDNQDIVVYKIVYNFFKAAEIKLFNDAADASSIIKTIGIQGLFDSLRKILLSDIQHNINLNDIDFSQTRYEAMLEKVSTVDFTNDFYQFSAVGRANVAETILLANDLVQTPNIAEARNEGESLRFERKIAQHTQIRSFLPQAN